MTDLEEHSRKRTRSSTGDNSCQPPKSSMQLLNLKDVLDSAKIKFETEQGPGQTSPEQKLRSRKVSSAPASPSKSLTVSVGNSEPRRRSRLLKDLNTTSSLLMPANQTSYSPKVKEECVESLNDDSKKQKKKGQGVSMSEVIRLHQDEGVINLLHALPSSRRRPSSTYVGSTVSTAPKRRRLSAEAGNSQKREKNNKLGGFLYRRHMNPSNILADLSRLSRVSPCTQEELMTQSSMEILKQLPTTEYVKMWSSPSRYSMAVKPVRNEVSSEPTPSENLLIPAQSSPCESVNSFESSVSKGEFSRPMGRTTPWRIQSKNFKDILIRTYSSFVQVILSPTTTGLKHSINANVCEELINILKQVEDDSECRAVLLTGIGGTFCQGADLTTLTHEVSSDKQRRAAEALAHGIKKLVKQLLSSTKVLVAAVNGKAVGLGVALLPYFDIVYASDKAEFSTDYVRLGQMPDGFAAHTPLGNCHEMLFFCHTMTPTMAQNSGLVTSVIWPSQFLEEIVPKVESLGFMDITGLRLMKTSLKSTLKKNIMPVMEEETSALISQWGSTEFAKKARHYLKSSHLMFQ